MMENTEKMKWRLDKTITGKNKLTAEPCSGCKALAYPLLYKGVCLKHFWVIERMCKEIARGSCNSLSDAQKACEKTWGKIKDKWEACDGK